MVKNRQKTEEITHAGKVISEPDFRKLGGQLVDYDLTTTWNSHWLMNRIRETVRPLVEERIAASDLKYDPQDLEHQALFFLTTYHPGEITEEVIRNAVETQAEVIEARLRPLSEEIDLNHLFRGLTGKAPDLNCINRLKLKNHANVLTAVGADGYERAVEFRLINDPSVIALFTGNLHYIHQERSAGDAFGLFFAGDRYPWALETAERSIHARPYKRASLRAHGFNPDETVELTRLYTLPGSPLNAVSILDGLVSRHYREAGLTAMYTRTMPSYSKSKSTTVAGGMNRVLCLKELRHYFVRDAANPEIWKPTTKRYLEAHPGEEYRMTHPEFRLLPAVDVFMPLVRKAPVGTIAQNSAIMFNETALNPIIPSSYAPRHHRHQESAQVRPSFLGGFRLPAAAFRRILAGA